MKKVNFAAAILSIAVLAGCTQPSTEASASPAANDTVYELATAQHTTRTFTSQTIAEEDLQKLLTVAFSGATSGGQQARDVVVVNDRTIMKEIQAVHVYAQSLDTAPIVFVITGDEDRAAYSGNLAQDTSIAAQNVVLMAESLGIATNIMSIYPSQDRITGIQKALQLPDHVIPYIMVAMGYSAEDTASASSSRSTDYDSMVHYNTWGE